MCIRDSDQRDRGRRKKAPQSRIQNELRRAANQHGAWDRILDCYQAWLAKEFPTEDEGLLKSLSSMSLKRYLQTRHPASIDIAPVERLRQLAIHWEGVCSRQPQPKGWKILERIYDEAISYDKSWPVIYHSKSLSLRVCAGMLNSDDVCRKELLQEALRICSRGIEQCPDDSSIYGSRGRVNYELDNPEESIVDSTKAIELDPQNMWAALYRAHAYHDLERWEEAVAAYEFVDKSFFDGPPSWRAVLLKDQLASCLLNSGNRERALELFESALNSYESDPDLLTSTKYLNDAACGELKSEIGDRVKDLFNREELSWCW